MLLPQTRLLGIVVLCFCWVTFAVNAQNPVPTHPVDGQYIKEWLVLGPFFSADLDRDLLADVGGEVNINPKEGDTLTTVEENPLTWSYYRSPGATVDFIAGIGNHEHVTAYAACTIISPNEQRVEARLGSDDGVKVWLNGKVIHTYYGTRRLTLNDDIFPMTLKSGENRLLIKVYNGTSGWALALQLWDTATYRHAISDALEVKAYKLPNFETGELKLSITARRTPKSPVFRLPPVPVTIEIRDTTELLFKETIPEGERLIWQVPSAFKGELQIAARQIDLSGIVRRGRIAKRIRIASAEREVEGIWDRYRSYAYRYVDGLASNDVRTILQDKEGAIWFGTQGGISRFDGKIWKTYTRENSGLVSNAVFTSFQAKDGAIWFGGGDWWTADGGVSRFDGEIWQTFTQADSGLAHNYVRAMIQDRGGVMWFGTQGGVSRFDGEIWKTYTQRDGLANNDVRVILQDNDGAMWFGTQGGVSRYDGENWQTYTQANSGLAGDAVLAIFQDRDGGIWFGTNSGVGRYDGKNWKTYTEQDGLPNNDVRSILQDKEGAMWFGTRDSVSRYDTAMEWHTYAPQHGLVSGSVNAILQSDSGEMWFGTDGGVTRIHRLSWHTFTEGDGLADPDVLDILEDESGAMWFSTDKGVSRFDGNHWQTFTQQDGLASNRVNDLLQDREGTIWFATWGGVSRFDGSRWQTYTHRDGLAGNGVNDIFEDREGTVWFATWGGVSRFDGSQWRTYTHRDGLVNNIVFSVTQDEAGVMWFGTQGGVSRYDGVNWKTYTQANSGLASNAVYAISQDNTGVMWFGTQAGISQYDGVNWKTYYTQKDLFIGDGVSCILEDSKGTIWFGTDGGGVIRFDGESFQTIDVKYGLPIDTVQCLYRGKNGNIWLGTKGGAVQMNLSNDERQKPWVRIVEVTTNEKHTDFSTPLRLTVEKRITLESHAIDFKTIPERQLYRYRIFESTSTNRHSLIADFPPTTETRCDWTPKRKGIFSFEVQAIDRDLNYSYPATVTLEVVLPWYRNGWIAIPIVSAILAVLAVGVVYSYRYDIQRRQAQRLEREAQQLRDKMLEQERLSRQTLQTTNAELAQAYKQIKTANIQLQARSEALEGAILESALDCIITIDEAGKIIEFNPAAEKTFGYARTAVIGKNMAETIIPPSLREAHQHGLAHYLATGEGPILGSRLEITGMRADGSEFPVELAVTPIPLGKTCVFTAHLRDITERKQAAKVLANYNLTLEKEVKTRTNELREKQAQLIQSAKMAALGNLVAGVAHEVNNPISAVKSAADISNRCIDRLVANLQASEFKASLPFQRTFELLKDNLRVIATGSERVATTVRSLKNFARLDEAELQKADLHEGLDSTLVLLHHEMKDILNVTKEYGSIPLIDCYPNQLNQVFMNLLVNAIEAIDGQGVIRITTSTDDQKVVVQIADTGRGILPEHLGQIFDPSFTTKGVGVGIGMGLPISHNIIEKHHGTIKVESAPGEGSVVTMTLPVEGTRLTQRKK